MAPEEFMGMMDWEGGVAELALHDLEDNEVPPEILSEFKAVGQAIKAFRAKLRSLGWDNFIWNDA